MQVKYGKGVKVLIPAEITTVEWDEHGAIYGIESEFYNGITYARESNIAAVNGHNVRGIVPEAVIEEAERAEKTGRRKIAPAQPRIKTEAEAAKKSEKPRKKPGPKPKAVKKPEKTEAPKESLKGTNAAKSSSTSSKLQGFKPMKPTSGVKKDGTPKKKPGPKPKKEVKEAAPAGQQEKAAPRQQEKKEDSEMVKLAKELAESVED